MTYKEFLKVLGHPSEEEFNEVVKSFPEVSYEEFADSLEEYWNDIDSVDDLASVIADAVVRRYTQHAYVDNIDLESNEVCIADIESLEELKKLNEVFSEKGWKIADYDYLEEEFIEAEEDMKEENIRTQYLQTICNLPTSKLKDIVENL